MTTPNLFDEPIVDMTQGPTLAPKRAEPTIEPNRSVPAAAAPRVTRQARAILACLRQGRAEVRDLAAIAKQYNARIYELRKAGYRIENVDQNQATGESWYELKSEPVAVGDGVFVVSPQQQN